jgi:hypothetical protein
MILSLLIFGLASCSKDNRVEEPVTPSSYETTFNVSLQYNYKLTNTKTGQVLINDDYGTADMNTLLYVIHRKSDGHYVKMGMIDSTSLKNITSENIAKVNVSLPKGIYYITFVAFKNFKVKAGDPDSLTIVKSLSLDYEDAAMQIPNDDVHYATSEFEVFENDGVNMPVTMILKKISADLIFEFYDAYKVPDKEGYRLTVGIDNIPSAFFLATGKSLTKKEVVEHGLHLYSDSCNVSVPAIGGNKAAVTIFHTLSNDNLPESDRGKYWFEFMETSDEEKSIKSISKNLDSFSYGVLSSWVYIYGLCDGD